jgi:hypothetical protein
MPTNPGDIETRTWLTGREQARLFQLAELWEKHGVEGMSARERERFAELLRLYQRVHDVGHYALTPINEVCDAIDLLPAPGAPLTAAERNQRYRQRQGAQPQPRARHGTRSGYQRHWREQSPACEWCRAAQVDGYRQATGHITKDERLAREAARVAELGTAALWDG